jgi:hypothetical protein
MQKVFAVLLVLVSLTTGCGNARTIQNKNAMSISMMSIAPSSIHFIAEHHKVEIISGESELPELWQSIISYCGTLRCEVVASSITSKTRDSAPSGSISLRLSPEDLNKLLAQLEKRGSIVQHTTESEDKTSAVVDAEAKIKNLTTFRDNLRTMLAKPSATVKDSVEIQQQLTDVQSQLDSEAVQRKILANQTEKVAVEIAFRTERPDGGGRGFAQITTALRESGAVLADSVASLITVVVAVIPWLILIVPLCWLLSRTWRRFRRKRAAPVPPSVTAS